MEIIPTKGEVWVGHDGWRVVVTDVSAVDKASGDKRVTFFAGYNTITEDLEVFLNGYTKEL